MRSKRPFAMLLLCLGLAAANPVAPQIENPEFKSWARHKEETTVVLSTRLSREGRPDIVSQETSRLMTKSDKNCAIEMTIKIQVPGQVEQKRKLKRNVPATTEQGKEYLPDGFEGSFEVIGKESVVLSGKSYECKIVTIDGKTQDMKATGKYWLCDDVPGLLVKGDMTGEPEGQKLVSHSELVSVDIK